jgi:CHAT domain-containing protein
VIRVSSLHFVSKPDSYAKRWLRLSIDRGIGTHAFQDELQFTKSERETVKKFLTRMEKISCRCSKVRISGQLSKTRVANKLARRRLESTGRKLFRIISNTRAPIDNLDSLGEYGSPLTLWVDTRTRKFPWELAFDGKDFLCTEFAVGRKVLNPEYEYVPQSKPVYRDALIVGLNYDWPDCKHEELLHCELEARSVRTQLKKLGYRVHVLPGKYATVHEVEKWLKKGVSIFHFTGHGAYRTRSKKGERGVLFLADGDLTTDDLRNCFECARGAPYLSFLNACQTAKEIYSSGLVDAFVDLGAENVIGTFWSVFDEPTKIFARAFYKSIIQGNTIGYAIQTVRNTFIYYRKAEEATTWPAFVLYGDPSHTLPRAP